MSLTSVVNSVNEVQVEDRKLKLREKVACVIGQAPNTFHYQMIQMYLLFFYTDVMKINAAYVAGLFLVIRILDAVIAPFLGAIMDRITTPWGKYRPWFIILGIPFGIFGWLTFTDFNLSPSGKLVYAAATYTIYSVIVAIANVPSGAVIPAVTKRVDDRVSIGQISYLFLMLGAVVVSVGALPIYKALGGGNDAKGFSLLMAIAAIITILISIYQVTNIKERYIVERNKDEKVPSLKKMLIASLTNKTAVIIYIYMFGSALGAGVRTTVQLHYFKYFFHNENLVAITGFVNLFPMLLGVALSSKVIKRIGLKFTVLSSVIVIMIQGPINLFVPSSSLGVATYIVASVAATFFTGLASPAQIAIMPAAIDYTEWKDGLNLNAFMNSIQGFIQTFATALSGALVAGALAYIGYVPGAEQGGSTILGIKVLMSIIPAIFTALTLCVMWFDLTEDKQAEITKELAERRKNAQA